MDNLFVDLLLEYGSDLDALFAYLSELIGSSSAADQAIITEDLVI